MSLNRRASLVFTDSNLLNVVYLLEWFSPILRGSVAQVSRSVRIGLFR
jgi:hypothetical protein